MADRSILLVVGIGRFRRGFPTQGSGLRARRTLGKLGRFLKNLGKRSKDIFYVVKVCVLLCDFMGIEDFFEINYNLIIFGT